MMHWAKLLNWDRLLEPRRFAIEPKRSPWQIDYDRIVFSSAFRRLQDKTQVFPLSGSDYIRTRLTHSLEVSTVGRTLGTMAGAGILRNHGAEKIENNGKSQCLRDIITAGDIGAIVAAAALAHDLGNPPFGHSGEDAVRHWFECSEELNRVRRTLTKPQRADFSAWEGNAQGFRILTRLQIYKMEGGMRLTNSTLAAFCKYPVQSADVVRSGPKDVSRKKFGVFQDDLAYFSLVAKATGLIRKRNLSRAWCRHPLAFLTEAADDICYHIVDLEDGFRLGRVPYNFARECLQAIAKAEISKLNRQSDNLSRIGYLRALAIRNLIDEVASVFEAHEQAMLRGELMNSLTDLIPSAGALKAIKHTTKDLVYNTASVLQIEAAGFKIIPGLLDLFWRALWNEKGTAHRRRSQKVLQLLPQEVVEPYLDAPNDAYHRMLRISDYVTGMTDSYALALYRKLNGIALPS